MSTSTPAGLLAVALANSLKKLPPRAAARHLVELLGLVPEDTRRAYARLLAGTTGLAGFDVAVLRDLNRVMRLLLKSAANLSRTDRKDVEEVKRVLAMAEAEGVSLKQAAEAVGLTYSRFRRARLRYEERNLIPKAARKKPGKAPKRGN